MTPYHWQIKVSLWHPTIDRWSITMTPYHWETNYHYDIIPLVDKKNHYDTITLTDNISQWHHTIERKTITIPLANNVSRWHPTIDRYSITMTPYHWQIILIMTPYHWQIMYHHGIIPFTDDVSLCHHTIDK